MNQKFYQVLIGSMVIILGIGKVKSSVTFPKNKSLILNKPECNDKRLEKIDIFFLKLVSLGKNGRKIPIHKNELQKFCKETERFIGEIEKFINECYPTDQQGILKIYIYGSKQSLKPFCVKKLTKKQLHLFEMAPCINTIIQNIDCLDVMTNRTYNLVQYNIGKDMIKYACCYYVDMLKCIEDYISIPCMSNSGKNLLLDLIRTAAGDMINFACGEYNELTDQCDILSPLPKSKLDKSKKIITNLKSLAFAQIAMLEAMGGL